MMPEMKTHRSLAALLLAGFTVVATATQVVQFASARASAPFPDSFQVKVSGDEVIATFGAKGDHTLQLRLLGALPKSSGEGRALDFIKEQGKKRGARVLSDGERATFSEAGAKEVRGTKTFQAMHWQIGVGNCVFTMTLTAPLPMSKELDVFLGEPLNAIVNNLSCAAP